jgi:nucleotide-binding universal stress UspA family protein
MQTLRHIVCGTDFSDSAEQALELATALAAAASVPVTVVHVCERRVDGVDDRRLARCGAALAEVVARHARIGLRIAGVLRLGEPWRKLDNVAAEVGAGLIVIGRSGEGRDRSCELGSVADQLVRCASRPVLTAPCNFDRLDAEARESNAISTKDNTP